MGTGASDAFFHALGQCTLKPLAGLSVVKAGVLGRLFLFLHNHLLL